MDEASLAAMPATSGGVAVLEEEAADEEDFATLMARATWPAKAVASEADYPDRGV